MIYEKETALLRKGLFDVQNEVGLGHHEEIYHKAMMLWLTRKNIPYVSKKPHPLFIQKEAAHTLQHSAWKIFHEMPWHPVGNCREFWKTKTRNNWTFRIALLIRGTPCHPRD